MMQISQAEKRIAKLKKEAERIVSEKLTLPKSLTTSGDITEHAEVQRWKNLPQKAQYPVVSGSQILTLTC